MEMEAIIKDMNGEIIACLEKYISYASKIRPFSTKSSTAYYMLLTRSCNAFISAYTLCQNGLHVDSYNSVRIGLENGWLALILREDETRALEWLTLVPSDNSSEIIEKKYRNTYGSVKWIRKEVSLNDRDKNQRDNIYGILSTKSHANVASTFFISGATPQENNFCLYAPGAMKDNEHEYKNLKGILYCLKYILYDFQVRCGEDFGVDWKYDHMSLFNIAGVGYPGKNGGMEVVSSKVNSAYQAMVLLEIFRLQQNDTQA